MENSERNGNTRPAAQEAAVRTGHGATDWFQIGKGVRQGCILSHNTIVVSICHYTTCQNLM